MKCNVIFLVVQVSLFWTVCVEALRCFDCFGTTDGPCFDPVAGNVSITNCEEVHGPGNYVCFKVINSVTGVEMVIRGCHPEAGIAQFCAGVTITGDAVCLSCSEDLCNSSNFKGPIKFMFLILSLLIIFK